MKKQFGISNIFCSFPVIGDMQHKRAFITVFVVVSAVLLAVSCSMIRPGRMLEVSIPDHPWESASGKKLWYTLKWTSGSEILSSHLGPDERSISIYVPVGETIIIAAYPLGEMAPFGAIITPLDEEIRVSLNQNDGVIANNLIDLDRTVTERLNYSLIREDMLKKCDDLRQIEQVSFLRDLQNGELRETSFKAVSLFGVDSFVLPNGLWTSEYLRDCSLFITDNLTPPLQLPEGVFRYLNPDMDRVLILIVDASGTSYSYLRQSLI